MAKLQYGLASYDRVDGRVDNDMNLPMGDVDTGNLISFLRLAADHDWELCGTLPGARAGSRRHSPFSPSNTRIEEHDHEVMDMIFKKKGKGVTKQEGFLWIIQTAILAGAANSVPDPNDTVEDPQSTSVRDALYQACEAVSASENIPDELSMYGAAREYSTHKLEGGSDPSALPDWIRNA